MLLNELTDGVEVEQVLLVKEAELRRRRDGGEYLRLMLGDRTGAVPCMVWEELEEIATVARAGAVVTVVGRYVVHPRFGPQINLRGLAAAAPGSYVEEDLADGPTRDVGQMEAEIRELVATVQQPQLRALLDRLLGPGSTAGRATARRPRRSTTTRRTRTGCSSTVSASPRRSARSARPSRGSTATSPSPERSCTTSASSRPTPPIPLAIDLSDAGRLHGEIALGYYLVRRTIEEIDGFPPELAQAIGHIILSHHGSLEHGSPVVPCTREATLVHMVDNLGGRLGSFDRLEKELAPGRRWSSFDRAIGAGAFFLERGDGAPEPARAPAPEREAA